MTHKWIAAALITLSGPQDDTDSTPRRPSGKTDLPGKLSPAFIGPQTETMSQLLAKN